MTRSEQILRSFIVDMVQDLKQDLSISHMARIVASRFDMNPNTWFVILSRWLNQRRDPSSINFFKLVEAIELYRNKKTKISDIHLRFVVSDSIANLRAELLDKDGESATRSSFARHLGRIFPYGSRIKSTDRWLYLLYMFETDDMHVPLKLMTLVKIVCGYLLWHGQVDSMVKDYRIEYLIDNINKAKILKGKAFEYKRTKTKLRKLRVRKRIEKKDPGLWLE